MAKKFGEKKKRLRIKSQIFNFEHWNSLVPRLSPENEHLRSCAHLELTSLTASFASLMLAGLIESTKGPLGLD